MGTTPAVLTPPTIPSGYEVEQAVLPDGYLPLPAAPGYRQPGPNPYQTPLDPAAEAQFQQWVAANKIPFDPSPKSDYDMRGFWQDIASKGSESGTQMKSDGLHYPDTYKTPFHRSASNESMYMPSDAPSWQGSDKDGWKLIDKTGKVVYDESDVKALAAQK